MITNPTPTQQETLLPCPLSHYIHAGLRAYKTGPDPRIVCFDCGLTLRAPDWIKVYERWQSRARAAVAGPRGDVRLILLPQVTNMLAAEAYHYCADCKSHCRQLILTVEALKELNRAYTAAASSPAPAEDTRVAGEAVRRARDWLKTYDAEKYYEGIEGMFRYTAQLITDLLAIITAAAPADNDAESSLLSLAVAVCKDLAEHVTQELTEQSDHPQRDILNYDDYRKGQIQAALEIESELRKLTTTKEDR